MCNQSLQLRYLSTAKNLFLRGKTEREQDGLVPTPHVKGAGVGTLIFRSSWWVVTELLIKSQAILAWKPAMTFPRHRNLPRLFKSSTAKMPLKRQVCTTNASLGSAPNSCSCLSAVPQGHRTHQHAAPTTETPPHSILLSRPYR